MCSYRGDIKTVPIIRLKQELERKGLEKKPEWQDLHYFGYFFPFCCPSPFSKFLFNYFSYVLAVYWGIKKRLLLWSLEGLAFIIY